MAQPKSKLGNQDDRIPTFQTVEEAAEFWDTHSLADYLNELEEDDEVRFVPAQYPREVAVPLGADELEAVTRQARDQGVEPSVLIRTWVLERLHRTEQAPSQSNSVPK